MKTNQLEKACKIALKDFMGLKEDEVLLIVSDEKKRKIGLALYEAGKLLCKESLYVEMKSRQTNGEEPPEAIASLMKQVNCVLCPTEKSLTHTNARREAAKLGVRIGTMPGIAEETMIRCLSADYSKIIDQSNYVNELLKDGKQIHITTKLGTDIKFNYEGRKIFVSTGVLRNTGDSGNLPSGEVYLAPLEGTTNGRIVVDGSIAGIGLVKDKVFIDVKDGYAVSISGKSDAKKFYSLLEKNGKDAFAIAEFGIGTNYKAKIIGKILEDEKVLGTIHMAFGNNISMGGNISVSSHYDVIVNRPTVMVDDKIIMKNGKII